MNKTVHIGEGISRRRLIGRVLDAASPITLIEAPAGCGKSWILAALAQFAGIAVHDDVTPPKTARLMLWDMDRTRAVPALPDLPPDHRLVIACRPGTMIPGLARMGMYGRLLHITADDLLFTADDLAPHPEAEQIIGLTGGWPCLVPPLLNSGRDADPGTLTEFLTQDVLAPMTAQAVVALRLLMQRKIPPAEMLHDLPFVDPQRPLPLHPVLTALGPHLSAAITRSLNDRSLFALAEAELAADNIPDAIAAFQTKGQHDRALMVVQDAGGGFYMHRFGPAAHDRMLAGFPQALLDSNDLLVICRAMRAVKQGEIALSRHIMSARWGIQAQNLVTFLSNRSLPVEVRFFRLLFATWEDGPVDDLYFDRANDLLAELPEQDHHLRGALYNAVMEAQIRCRRFAAADLAAIRSASHFAMAGVPVLSFYIALHRSIIALARGQITQARDHAAQASNYLNAMSWDSPGDRRILTFLDACIAYETGHTDSLARFLWAEMDDLAQAEIWPALAELALIYGPQALLDRYSTEAARRFLDGWRHGLAAASVGLLADIREIGVLQSGGRWHEAAARAATLPGHVTADFMAGGGLQRLAALNRRDELALALAWLRQMAHEPTPHPALPARIRAMLTNPGLTARQRTAAEIWLAHVLRRLGHLDEAAANLTRILAQVWRSGARAVLAEERAFITDLLSARRMRERLERCESARPALRWLTGGGPAEACADTHGLTRQERRILDALADGLPNK
ncbi:MAG: hypothetical protein Q4G49_14415, partial [Paracoccus sp. (in: a-proteobacteria)]|nr:hypothetical protein [Paracoccus sp. (in: a-proteobacteria)]